MEKIKRVKTDSDVDEITEDNYVSAHGEDNGRAVREIQIEGGFGKANINSTVGFSGNIEPEVGIEENSWVLQTTGTPEEVEIEETTTGTNQVESHVVDLSEQFNRIFVQTVFNSFEEFEELFNKFKSETGSVFRIKSSCSVSYENARRKKHFIPDRFKFVSVKYCCVHYGQPKVGGQGIRTKQRYLPCGCECILSVSYSRGALVITYANMQHNHEVSNKMAPYYAINRRISNRELRQVANVVELISSSRALQQFLQERFQRPTTLQDAKNIRARLKAFQSRQAKNATAVRSVKAEPVIHEEEEEDDGFEMSKPEVSISVEDIVKDDDGDEVILFEQQDEHQEHYVEEQVELNVAPSPKWKEKVIKEVKEKLSELMNSCDNNVFWERMSVINKIIECWENGDNFDVHYAAESGCGDGEGTVDVNEREPSSTGNECSPLPKQKATSQVMSAKPKIMNTPPSLAGSSNSQLNFMLPVLSGSDVQFLPASVCAESLKLFLGNGENEVQVNTSGIKDKSPIRLKRAMNDPSVKQDRDIEELSSGQSFPELVNSLKSNVSSRVQCDKNESEGQCSASQVKEPVFMSVTRGKAKDICDQATEIEIEVDGTVIKVKEVKLEPIEYHEVDVTDDMQVEEHLNV